MCYTYRVFHGAGIREVVFKTTREDGSCLVNVDISGSNGFVWKTLPKKAGQFVNIICLTRIGSKGVCIIFNNEIFVLLWGLGNLSISCNFPGN